MYKNRSKGFTLIELLVVIAIIGVLSSVVLASLNTARSKGNDASVQSNLATIHTQAEIFYGNNSNSYGTTGSTCTAAGSLFLDTTIARAITSTEVANGSASVICNNTTIAYAISSQLPTTLGGTAAYWCVDSTGFSGRRVTVQTTSVCPAT
ncbi:MAG: type II secretion system protein [bacterium]|nr:type II secretion system protein [bacterium]